MSGKTRIFGALMALTMSIAGVTLFQATVEDRVASLETRVATLEARSGIAGATPLAVAAPTETTEARAGDIVLSGAAGESITEPFELTLGNWFARVEQDQAGGRFIAYAVQFEGGDNKESIFYLYEDPPVVSESSFTIYDFTGGAGSYVLEVEAEYPWTLTLSKQPF